MPTGSKPKRPPIGTKVMRPYGRRDYTDYGEIGTVTAHNDDGSFQMTLSDQQPYCRWMWGAKAKPTDNAGYVHERLTPSEVTPLSDVYRQNELRFRRVATEWAALRKELLEDADGRD